MFNRFIILTCVLLACGWFAIRSGLKGAGTASVALGTAAGAGGAARQSPSRSPNRPTAFDQIPASPARGTVVGAVLRSSAPGTSASKILVRSSFQKLVIKQAETMLEPKPNPAPDDEWMRRQSAALTGAAAAELGTLAQDRSAPFPGRFLAVTLISNSSVGDRARLLVEIAASGDAAENRLAPAGHLDRTQSHERMIRKLAIDGLAKQGADPDIFLEIAKRQNDPHVRAYAQRVAGFVTRGKFTEFHQKEDDVLAKIAEGHGR